MTTHINLDSYDGNTRLLATINVARKGRGYSATVTIHEKDRKIGSKTVIRGMVYAKDAMDFALRELRLNKEYAITPIG